MTPRRAGGVEIPKEAMPVVMVLRRDVKRPVGLPKPIGMAGNGLRWNGACPMGLHQKSRYKCPGGAKHFAGGVCRQKSVSAFWCWWDRIKKDAARAAVDAIWPVKLARRRKGRKGL